MNLGREKKTLDFIIPCIYIQIALQGENFSYNFVKYSFKS